MDLYDTMVSYICDHYDDEDAVRFNKIQNGISQKRESQERRAAYSAYKTSNDPKTRESARQKYLELAGIHKDFQW